VEGDCIVVVVEFDSPSVWLIGTDTCECDAVGDIDGTCNGNEDCCVVESDIDIVGIFDGSPDAFSSGGVGLEGP